MAFIKRWKLDLEADMQTDIEDRREDPRRAEPLVIGADAKERSRLADLAIDLAAKASGLRRSLPSGIAKALAELVRVANCYYSNLIEGHGTHPGDIERALRGEFDSDPQRRDLQIEAKAHIAVQAWIDRGGLGGDVLTVRAIREIHRRFCQALPDGFLKLAAPGTGESIPIIPGELRTCDVQVGRHVPVSPGALPRFLERFEIAYRGLGRLDAILAVAASHHRFLWIHPFLDGNGRVARLMSHAALGEALDTGGVWSVARGLARREGEYKARLQACDLPRRNDLDGRGHLSEEALVGFVQFFLSTCIDQVEFMEGLVQPDRLRRNILAWAQEEIDRGRLPALASAALEAILYRGALLRGEVARVLRVGERQARRITAALLERRVLVSENPRAPLRLAFPAALAPRWMPGLFPEQPTARPLP